MNIDIEKIVVLQTRDGADEIYVHTKDLLPPMPKCCSQPLILSYKAAKGYGADHVREVFGMEPEVIE
jgi:hypothetical protein